MSKLFYSLIYFEGLIFFRDRKIMFHSLGFFTLVVSIFSIGFSDHPETLHFFTPVILWVAVLFSILLSLENWLANDVEDQALEQLILSPQALPYIILAKLLAFWAVIVFPLLLITPLISLLFQLTFKEISIFIVSLFIITPSLVCIGATCKALILGLKQQGVILGLLVLPLTLPMVIMGINILSQTMSGLPVYSELLFLSGVTLLSLCCLPLCIAYAIRLGMEI